MRSPLGDRVLAVVAHPDDEAWAMGGTLARCADAGATVHVLCMTRGEGGGDPTVRASELAASCAILGATHRLLDLPDGALATFPVEQARTLLQREIDAFAPTAVLTLGPDGGYGHLDHIAVTDWLADCGVPVWHAVFPPGLMHPVWRGLRRAKVAPVRKGLSPEAFGSEHAELIVDIVVDRKRAAVAAHASQLPGGDPERFLRPGLLAALGDAERWTRSP